MKWRRARSPNGTSASCTPGGYQRLRIGKFGRCRCGAAPIAVSRLVARARWSISCLVTSTITASQPATLASCSALSPSCWLRLRVNWANRYSHISPCSSSQAWASSQTSSSRLSTRSGGSTAIGPPGFGVMAPMLSCAYPSCASCASSTNVISHGYGVSPRWRCSPVRGSPGAGRRPLRSGAACCSVSHDGVCLQAPIARRVLCLDNPEPSKQGRHAGFQLPRVGRAMDLPTGQSTPTSAPPIHPTLRAAVRSPRHRRPTGAAPPLPYRLQTSGIGWLVAAVVLIGLTLAVFAGGLRGPAVAVTVVDDAVVGWLAGLVGPGLLGPLRGLARIGSWWVLYTLSYGLLLTLLVLRRWRHLLVWLVAVQLGAILITILAAIARRPRPFGVDLQASWGGWALPSIQVAFLTAILMGVLYTLVPEGRWRNTGKWLVAGLVTLVGMARIALGVDAPTDVLVGVGIGVTIPLLLFRRFTPNEVFPVAYRRGRGAHLDVGGARGMAIRRALEDQLGLVVEEVKPFGLAGSAGSTPLRITVKGDPPRQLFGKLYAQSHLRSDRWYKLGRELLYGRLEDEKPFNTVRRLVQQEDYALALMQR